MTGLAATRRRGRTQTLAASRRRVKAESGPGGRAVRGGRRGAEYAPPAADRRLHDSATQSRSPRRVPPKVRARQEADGRAD